MYVGEVRVSKTANSSLHFRNATKYNVFNINVLLTVNMGTRIIIRIQTANQTAHTYILHTNCVKCVSHHTQNYA